VSSKSQSLTCHSNILLPAVLSLHASLLMGEVVAEDNMAALLAKGATSVLGL